MKQNIKEGSELIYMSNDFLEELRNFLASTYHQDINSPEDALKEFINESSKKYLLSTIQRCERLLRCELTEVEKEKFLEDNTELNFLGIGLTPLQWLNELVEQMKEAVKIKYL